MRLADASSRLRPLSCGAALLGVLLLSACADELTSPDLAGGEVSAARGGIGPPQDLGAALAAQRAHGPRLMALEDVVGTAVGIAEGQAPSLVVYLTRPGARGVPAELDGVPVKRVVTGRIDAVSNPTTRLRPVPVGYSVGHPDITAGTYGARVTDGSGTFMLSNNHVLAASNAASSGDPILQPGAYDGGTYPDDWIATLDDYQAIDFSGAANLMDAAVAVPRDPADLSAATPADDGYGAPSSSVYALDGDGDGSVDAGVVGLAVKKYGRTTALTHGQVAEISVQVSVCYEPLWIFCARSALFVDQLGIAGDGGAFSGGGDSGSLIVTGSGANPVGLLFAGGGDRTFANRIDHVLDRFGVTVDAGSGDDGGGSDPGNAAPTATFTHACTVSLSCDFDASGSTDDGTIESWAWDFGDGTDGTGVAPTHDYQEAGAYTVTLTVTDDLGATGSTSRSVRVGNQPPVADFLPLCSGLSCAWDGGYSTDPDGDEIVSFAWTLGDGTEKSGQIVSHTYAAGGTYEVTLTVTDDLGATGSTSRDVTVDEAEPPPPAELTLSVQASKVKGVHTLELSWSGATTESVDVHVDGDVVATVAADAGSYTHSTGNKGKGSYAVQVCEVGGSAVCSEVVNVTY